jgi:DNA replication protein DnaC
MELESRERGLMDRLLGAQVLVLDEPFAVPLSPWGAEQMVLLVGNRHQERRATLVTSNLSPTALQPDRGHAPCPSSLASRLLSGVVVHFTAPDARLRRPPAGEPPPIVEPQG